MRILLISLALVTLASCSLSDRGMVQPTTETTTESSGQTVEKVKPTAAADGTYVTVNYTLRDGAADGQILETTLYSVAQENGIEGEESNFQPFSVMLGAGQLIKGFEDGIMGLKVGDTKTIEVPPELGYGTGPTLTTVPKFQIAPVFTITQDQSIFEDTITETVPRENLPDDMKNASVGQTFTGANNATAKVVSTTDADITLEIENTNNPFYKKNVVVGATAESPTDDASYKITAMEGTGVTIEVTNKNSPFYNKNFAVGESLDLPTGKIEIKEINEEEVVIAQAHPMAGKTLFFDVEVLDIQ